MDNVSAVLHLLLIAKVALMELYVVYAMMAFTPLEVVQLALHVHFTAEPAKMIQVVYYVLLDTS